MHGRHRKKTPKLLVFRGVLVFILALVLSVSSFATVMATTVSALVIDGDKSYTFNMTSTDLDEILAQAEEQGLEPLGPLDVAEQVDNTTTVNVRRGVSLSVLEAGKRTNLMAYRGDTVLKTLEDNNIILKDEDQVVPSRDSFVEAGLSIEIRRACQVTVAADGEIQKLSLIGGNVADALAKAGVALTGGDSTNYGLNETLFDSMIIRVSRPVRLTVTADGVTVENEVSAATVLSAVKKCGVELSEDDILSVDPKAKPEDGMHIVVTRVTTEEATEIEEIEYPTEYVISDELYSDETEVLTYGESGEKQVTYKLIYAEGQLVTKEVVSEEILREPVTEVIAEGSMEREEESWSSYDAEEYEESDDDSYSDNSEDTGYSAGGVGTFVDSNGNTVAYTARIEGSCTAYTAVDGITSTGLAASYGIIAVDPNIIPYGTQLYITSPDGSIVYGYGVAGDTGSALMAGSVIADLYYNTEEECDNFGRRNMVIYILG